MLLREHPWGRHLVGSVNIYTYAPPPPSPHHFPSRPLKKINDTNNYHDSSECRHETTPQTVRKWGTQRLVAQCSYISPANRTPLRKTRQNDKEHICFSPRNLTGCSRYKTSITTTSAVTPVEEKEGGGGGRGGGMGHRRTSWKTALAGLRLKGLAQVNAFFCDSHHPNNSKYHVAVSYNKYFVMCIGNKTAQPRTFSLSTLKNKKYRTFIDIHILISMCVNNKSAVKYSCLCHFKPNYENQPISTNVLAFVLVVFTFKYNFGNDYTKVSIGNKILK